MRRMRRGADVGGEFVAGGGRGGMQGIVICCAAATPQVSRQLYAGSRVHVSAGEFNSLGEC